VARLANSDQETLSRVLLELYQPCTLEDFPGRLFAALRRCLSGDLYCYTELHPNGAIRIVAEPAYRASAELFTRNAHQSPSVNMIVTQKVLSPVKISDFVSLTEWQRKDLYNEHFRTENQRYQLGFISPHNSPHLGVTLNRSTKDFSEEERQMLDLIRPHLVQAYENTRIYSLLGKGLEAGGSAFVIANDLGRIVFTTAGSETVIDRYFGPISNQRLPDPVRNWLEQYITWERSIGSSPPGDLIASATNGRVTVKYLSQLQTGEHQLLLHEQQSGEDLASLQELGLTQREAEVLFWVSQGKRNSEIGIILGTRPKTITKHLERIFEKLGVETRTAATAIALDYLGRGSRVQQIYSRSGY
jgi:DNA-binding CsgD family transcriptional regulator